MPLPCGQRKDHKENGTLYPAPRLGEGGPVFTLSHMIPGVLLDCEGRSQRDQATLSPIFRKR